MSSPIPPDPYDALGVTKDADLSAIRSAHRKLVLKHHPDRIKDEALKEKGKNEFQKIQQAYEILSDPIKRTRYDDKIKLAELRKEAMMRDPPTPRREAYPTSYPLRTASASKPPPREYRDDGYIYEERVPSASSSSYFDTRSTNDSRDRFFDSKERFEEPVRSSSRKNPEYERKASNSKQSDKRENASKIGTAAAAFVIRGLKDQANRAREKVKERELHAKQQEQRDREKRKERSEKQQTRRPYVVDATDSDSDTGTRVTTATDSTIRPSRPSPRSRKESEQSKTRSSGPSRSYDEDDESDGYDPKWERHHQSTAEYIAKASQRPGLGRSGSDAYDYWAPGKGRSGGERISGSDSERRPTSSKGRHNQDYDELPHRPAMPTYSSAPTNLKAHVEERIPAPGRRAGSGSYVEPDREHRREMPAFTRSQTVPSPRPSASKKDNVPTKGSKLKNGETHDSGYGSSSSPQTPEMRGESPDRPTRSKQTSTKYHIVDPEVDDEQQRRPRINRILPEEDRHRRYLSPEGDRRESDRDREWDRERRSGRGDRERERPERPHLDTDVRPRSSRNVPTREAKPSVRRTESSRYESSRPSRESPTLSRHESARERSSEKLFAEISGDERDATYRRPYPVEKVNQARYSEPKYANYRDSSPERRDFSHGSKFQDNLRSPNTRRPSVF